MDGQNIQQVAQQLGPQMIQQAVAQAMSQINIDEISADELRPLIAGLEETMKNPDLYPQMLQAMIEAGIAEPGDLPDEFDPTFVTIMIITLYEIAKKLAGSGRGFRHGGLARAGRELAAAGRNGDTMVAHINPLEAAALRQMGGRGTINPTTGLVEFGFFKSIGKAISGVVKGVTSAVKGVVKALGPIAPIITAVIAPYAVPWLSTTLGINSLAAGALYGAGTSAITGGDPLRGAVMGALGGGLGGTVGGTVSDALNLGLSPGTTELLGNTLIGGALGAATGQGFGKGALGAATGTMLGQSVGNLAGAGADTRLGAGLQSAGKTIGMMTTAGSPLKQALLGGLTSGALGAYMKGTETPLDKAAAVGKEIDSQTAAVEKVLADPNVSESAKQAYRDYQQQLSVAKNAIPVYEEGLRSPEGSPQQQGALQSLTTAGASGAPEIYETLGVAPPASAGLGATNVGMNLPTAMVAGSVLAPLALEGLAKAQTPEQVQQAVQQGTNPVYFNDLRIQAWDWDELSRRAAAANQPLGAYVANNWNNITSESMYTQPGGTTSNPQLQPLAAVRETQPAAMARGGLSRIAYLAQGAGTGRSDTIDARLSDGEYVMDAETVAMLGDGSTRAGAQKLDQMRSALRRQKGAALARGKISPNAKKSPLNYIKEAA